MTEELKQAISALQCAKRGHCDHAMADEAIAALEALTQRPAAQTEREAPYGYCPECGAPGVTRERRPDGDDKCSNGHRYPSRSAHASLPTQPAAQEMPDAVEHYGTVDDLPAAQATPEPVLRFCPGCGSVGDVPDTFRDCCPDGAKARLIPASLAHSCHDLFKLAIGAAQQSATPEPVRDVRCEGCGYMTHHREHMGCVRAAKQHTHPAPDGWTEADADAARLAMELECLLLDTKDTAAVSRWWKSANEALDLHRARLAAAQAKGADK